MSKRRTESFSAADEQRWQAQERALHDRVTPVSGDERVQVDDAAILDALSQLPVPVLPADFVAAVTAASESLRERRRQVQRFRRAVFSGWVLAYVAMAGIGLPMFGGASTRMAALAVRHGLYDAPWLAAAQVAAALIATLGRHGDRQRGASH